MRRRRQPLGLDSYGEFVEVVDQMIANGHDFDAIEAYIDALPISESVKGMLWLVAFGEQSRPTRDDILRGMDLAA